MLDRLAPGDVVTVTRIDRLARSNLDLFAIVKRIVDAKAQFRSLAEPWADTGTRTGGLMLAVLGGLADVERDLIRTRTAEGRGAPRRSYRGAVGSTPSASPQGRRDAADGAPGESPPSRQPPGRALPQRYFCHSSSFRRGQFLMSSGGQFFMSPDNKDGSASHSRRSIETPQLSRGRAKLASQTGAPSVRG
jgi:hypothetical protein